jgi:AcrR family transcriptional regulator
MARAKIEDERKEQILKAFEACVIRFGLAKTTLQKVADEAGLPRSLVRYFVGNRDSMVDLLIARMIKRTTEAFAADRELSPGLSTRELVDFLFDQAMGDDTSNNVVGELWYLAQRDKAVRKNLSGLYQTLVDSLVEQMTDNGIGTTDQQRHTVAYTLMSLAYGDSSFAFLNLKTGDRSAARQAAYAMTESLMSK